MDLIRRLGFLLIPASCWLPRASAAEELAPVLQADPGFLQMHRQLLLGIGSGAALLVALSLVWGFYLLRQVRRAHRAEQGLGEQLALLGELIEAIPNPVFRLDREGRMSLCNRAMLQLFGCRLEDCQGRTIDQLGWFPADVAARLMQEHRRQIDSGRMPPTADYHLQLIDRELFVYRWAVAQRDAKARIQGVIGGWVDLTERHQLMGQLEAERQRADAANAAKSQFLSAMSHEIRTPMNAIIGLQELVLERARGGVVDSASLEVAQDAARSLLMLIGNVLDMARIESGHIDSSPSPAHLLRQIEGSVSLFRGLALQKGLKLELVAEGPLDSWVLLDGLRFKQVLFNLLNNAIKFTGQGGVTLRTSAVPSGAQLDLLLEVIDTGIGISVEDQARLFRPFVQVEQPARQAGSGLGLHISRRLVELMGGSLELRSEPGRGSCFGIRLRLALTGAPEEGTGQDASAGPGRSLRVLAVDDHPANRLVFQQQLEHLGHQVRLAANGQQAWDIWQGGDFDVLLTDCRMSGMDGYELSRRVRDEECRSGRKRCLILGATANAREEEIQRCREAGMDEVLFKPLTLEGLQQALGGAGNGQRPEAAGEVDGLFTLDGLFGADAHQNAAAHAFVRTLLETNEQDLALLRQFYRANERRELGELAHRLAGIAVVISAAAVEARCRALQALCEGAGELAEADVETVETALRALQHRLRDWLAQAVD